MTFCNALCALQKVGRATHKALSQLRLIALRVAQFLI
ncbi:hypothetical protein X726_32715 [Mesorhizobium sp. L103C105A0]|nr:hypothetical protein X726_32715 [Mesorhizobium sp. L103C105A0]